MNKRERIKEESLDHTKQKEKKKDVRAERERERELEGGNHYYLIPEKF